MGCQGLQVRRHHRNGLIAREWHHLGYENAGAALRPVLPQFLGQSVAAHERNGHKPHLVHTDVPRPRNGRRHRPVRPYQNHPFRLAAPQVKHPGFHRRSVALVQPYGHGLHTPPLQRRQRPLVARPPERIILVHYRNPLNAQVRGQPFHHFLGFLVVGSPHIDDIGQLGRVPQEGRPGKRANVRHPGLFGHRRGRARSRRPHRANQRKNAILFNQARGVGNRRLGFIGVVPEHQLQPAPVHPAVAVRLGKGRHNPPVHTLPQLRGGAGKSGRLAEYDTVVKNPRRAAGIPH